MIHTLLRTITFHDFISVIALLVSICSMYLAYQNSPSQILKREQRSQMNILATRVLYVYDGITTLASAKKAPKESSQDAANVSEEQSCALENNARRLEESLDKVIGLGLWEQIWDENHRTSNRCWCRIIRLCPCQQKPDRGRHDKLISTYGLFLGSLASAISSKRDRDKWHRPMVLGGLSRLIICLSNQKQLDHFYRKQLQRCIQKQP